MGIVSITSDDFQWLSDSLPSRLYDNSGNWSLVLWLEVGAGNTGERCIMFGPDDAGGAPLFLLTLDGADVAATVHTTSGNLTATVTLLGVPDTDDRLLIVVTWHNTNRDLTLYVRNGADSQSNVAAGTAAIEAVTGTTFGVGAYTGAAPLDSIIGDITCMTLRTNLCNATDVAGLWASNRADAPISYPAAAFGESAGAGTMNGVSGVYWCWGFGALAGDSAIGSAVDDDNVAVYQTGVSANFETGQDATVSGDAAWASAFASGAFNPARVPTGISVVGPLPRTTRNVSMARLARRRSRTEFRLAMSGNSRATRRNQSPNADGSRNEPENYPAGWWDEYPDEISGVVFAPPKSGTNNGSWWGFDNSSAANLFSGGAAIADADSNWCRCWTGSSASDRGPGQPILIPDGGRFITRCAPRGLATVDRPLYLAHVLMRYPGAGVVTATRNRHSAQGTTGTSGGNAQSLHCSTPIEELIDLNSVAAETGTDESTLVVANAAADGVRAGHCCFIRAGTNAGHLNFVASVSVGPTNTTIAFGFPWHHNTAEFTPASDDVLLFGRYDWTLIEDVYPAVASGQWRGLDLTCAADGDNDGPIVVCGHTAIARGVGGLAVGQAGWAGHGYDEQMAEAAPGAIEAHARLFCADAYLIHFAQQGSDPDSLRRYARAIKASSPKTDVWLVGDPAHGAATTWSDDLDADWHAELPNAAAVAKGNAIDLVSEPTIGDWPSQVMSGMRSDSAHIKGVGNREIARLIRLRTGERQTSAASSLGWSLGL